MNEKFFLSLTAEERELILSSLGSDRVGTWGDGRQEKINRLMNRIKRLTVIPEFTGFTK